jgi:hypothetical protein
MKPESREAQAVTDNDLTRAGLALERGTLTPAMF